MSRLPQYRRKIGHSLYFKCGLIRFTMGGLRPAWVNLITTSVLFSVAEMITCSAPRDSVAEHPASLNGPVCYCSPLGECCGCCCRLRSFLFSPCFPNRHGSSVISATGPVPVIVVISVPAASVIILVPSLVYWARVIITAIVGAPFSGSLPSIIISPFVIIAIPVVTAVGWSPIIVVAPSPPVLSLRVASLIRSYWRRGVEDRCYRWRRITCVHYLWRVGDLCGLRPLFYRLQGYLSVS